MTDIRLTLQMKVHVVINVLKEQHAEIVHFLKIAQSSFVVKGRKKLEAADGYPTTAAKDRTSIHGPDTIRTHKFVRKIKRIIDTSSEKQSGPSQKVSKCTSLCGTTSDTSQIRYEGISLCFMWLERIVRYMQTS